MRGGRTASSAGCWARDGGKEGDGTMQKSHVGMVMVMALACCTALPAPVEGQAVSRTLAVERLSVEQEIVKDVNVAPAPGGLEVVAWVDRPDYTYARGEEVTVFVETSKDAYVTVLNVDPAGGTTVLFPNRYQPDNLVRAGRAVRVPDPRSGARITVTGTVGAELLKVIASTQRVDPFEAGSLSEAGPYRVVNAQAEGVAARLTRSLRVERLSPASAAGGAPSGASAAAPSLQAASARPAGRNEWAVCHQTIATIDSPSAAAQRTRSLLVVRNDTRPAGATCDERGR